MTPRFEVGQLVRLRADGSRSGPVVEVLPPSGGQTRYRIFHSQTDIREYHEDQLVPVAASGELGVSDALVKGAWESAETFRARLVAARLAHPLTDNLYAMQAARIHHIPFQFKPVLRFLRADRPRLLIADEVGVGKTIEAGLILRELQSRQEIGNVLIVCPKALVSKWHAEMRRFEEDFRPLNGESLRYCIKEAHLDGAWPNQYSRAIAPVELLRHDDYLVGVPAPRAREGLLTLSPPPQFGLLIVDEAHHVRNPSTRSYELARFLCDVSEAVLFLTATPVHLGSQNLFTLLNLLRPDLYLDQTVFAEMAEPNTHINEAIRHVRTRSPDDSWRTQAASSLSAAGRTNWGRSTLEGDRTFMQWRDRLERGSDVGDDERVRCVRDLEDLNSFAHVMNRTRRRDIGRFTLRDPHTISVEFTPDQQAFYESLLEFRKSLLSLKYDDLVVRLISDTLERQAASCLPALVPTLDHFIKTGRVATADVSDASDEDHEVALPADLLEKSRQLRALAERIPDDDPKLERLLEIVREVHASQGPGKLLVFSFFLHTLGYLQNHLHEAGYRVAMITGKVPDAEREHLRERFRLPRAEPNAIDVLLSSEVGCEGLDYEFCDRLVNYDIPWNPMRIEQRIGRIDRFGQIAEKVLIFNFITPGTVEERIYFRCFERLGVFRETVGDLEEVLGDVVHELSQALLNPSLTAIQAEEKAHQAADNAIRIVDEQRRLEDEGSLLFGLETFVEDVKSLTTQGRYVSGEDLKGMIARFLELPETGGRMSPEEGPPSIYHLHMTKDGRAALLQAIRILGKHDRASVGLIRWLGGADPSYPLTFDQETALERREIAFVTPLHPLARLATLHWASQSSPLVSHLAVSNVDLPNGNYLFLCELWETIGLRNELRLRSFAWNLERWERSPGVADRLLSLLPHGKTPVGTLHSEVAKIREAIAILDEEAFVARSAAVGDLKGRNDALIARKKASLNAYYRSRLRRVDADIATATESRILRMREAEKNRVKHEYQSRQSELENQQEADIVTRRVAAGILEIQGGP